MSLRFTIVALVMVVAAAAAVSLWEPDPAQAHSSCMYCHTPHNSVFAKLGARDLSVAFNTLCESCHATGTNAAPDALTHVFPGPASNPNPYWNFGCDNCHTTHNIVYNENYVDSATVFGATRTGTGPWTATLTLSKDLGLAVNDWLWVDRVISTGSTALRGYNGAWQVTSVDAVNKTVSFSIPNIANQKLGDPGTYTVGGIAAVGHAHTGGGAGGGLNIKRIGRAEDGSGIGMIATPLPLLGAVYNNVTPPTPCSSGNVAVQVVLPLFREGYGVPHTVMIGDRVKLLNVNPAAYDGNYVVTETFKGANKDRICLTRSFGAAPGTYAATDLFGRTTTSTLTNGWLFSTGWATPLTVTGASHSNGAITFTVGSTTGIHPPSAQSAITTATSASQGKTVTATVTLSASIGVVVGDTIVVSGVSVPGYNGTYLVSAVGASTVSYVIPANPGAGTGGTASTADGDIVRVFGVTSSGPGTFNGKWEVSTVVDATHVTVRCPPAHDSTIAASSACKLIAAGGGWVDPGTYSSGGKMQSSGTLRPVVFESRGTDYGYPLEHSFADEDTDQDAVMDGPCELCHGPTMQNHINDLFTDSHNPGRTCSDSCHPHGQGFDKATNPAGLDSPCPVMGCIPPAQPYP